MKKLRLSPADAREALRTLEKNRIYLNAKCDPWESSYIQFIFHDVGDSKQTHFSPFNLSHMLDAQ